MPRRRRSPPLLLSLALALAGASCFGAGTRMAEDGPCEPTLESVRSQIFLRTCSVQGCHGAHEPAFGLVLSDPDVETLLAGAGSSTCEGEVLLVPGDPEASLIVKKIRGTACLTRMPQGGEPLSDEEIACIEGWIAAMDPQLSCETCGTGACVNLLSDPEHCGDCDSPCESDEACDLGECE
jgi:hypothetical protein